MIPRFENITELQVWLLWELMQGGQRRDVALAYVRTPEFVELCAAHNRPDLPARLQAGTDAKLAALFHKVHRQANR
jgi:hypothetical protein